MDKHPVDLAAEILGTKAALARAMGVSQQHVQKWRKTRVPAERVLTFERVTGISRSQIRPDIYPT